MPHRRDRDGGVGGRPRELRRERLAGGAQILGGAIVKQVAYIVRRAAQQRAAARALRQGEQQLLREGELVIQTPGLDVEHRKLGVRQARAFALAPGDVIGPRVDPERDPLAAARRFGDANFALGTDQLAVTVVEAGCQALTRPALSVDHQALAADIYQRHHGAPGHSPGNPPAQTKPGAIEVVAPVLADCHGAEARLPCLGERDRLGRHRDFGAEGLGIAPDPAQQSAADAGDARFGELGVLVHGDSISRRTSRRRVGAVDARSRADRRETSLGLLESVLGVHPDSAEMHVDDAASGAGEEGRPLPRGAHSDASCLRVTSPKARCETSRRSSRMASTRGCSADGVAVGSAKRSV